VNVPGRLAACQQYAIEMQTFERFLNRREQAMRPWRRLDLEAERSKPIRR
jgi:hypothetical protein